MIQGDKPPGYHTMKLLESLGPEFMAGQEHYLNILLQDPKWMSGHRGISVAILGKEIVDQDKDFDSLRHRVLEKYGKTPQRVYCVEVGGYMDQMAERGPDGKFHYVAKLR